MAKVFRLHQGQNGTGWFPSSQVTNEQLKTILTEGKDVATSIPSPFARIDLVKSAFGWVAEHSIEGNSAQHKLVSEALDVAQLFFIYPKHQDKIKIVSWNPNNRLESMSNIRESRHSIFAETLKVYWSQDSQVYNFDKVNRLYFLLNNANQIIGGTSPATLFFSSPDIKKTTKELHITCDHDVLFDEIFMPLHKRNKSFVEYFFLLSKQPHFAEYFPEVYSYMEEVKIFLNHDILSRIAALKPNDIQSFRLCPVLNNEMNPCEVLNINLRIQTEDPIIIERDSDFVIKADLQIEGLKPLVLPLNRFANQWIYTTDGCYWNPNNGIPEKNKYRLEESVLPIQGDKYPWLTAGNFLEDYIIELPYNIDSLKFKTCGAKKHLLPLTSTYFNYFFAESVTQHLSLQELAGGGIEAKLEIPVKRGNITFKKTYHTENIIKLEVHLAILPFLRSTNIELDYTLAILQDNRFRRNNELFIQCYNRNGKVNISNPVIRSRGEDNTIKSIYHKSKSFETIRLGTNNFSGFIVPNMPSTAANQQVSFAIDFGTTNTHIEYKCGLNAEKSFDITGTLPIWQSLIDRSSSKNEYIADNFNYEKDLFPYLINENTNYKFPFRTALTYNKSIDFNEPIEIFSQSNGFLLFEKIFYNSNYLNLHTKLKWSNYAKPEDKFLVESYIEFLIYMVLYKTLILNGNPNTTKITWFYPVSMDSYEQGIFFNVWQTAYQKIFNTNNIDNINAIPESIAPYLHYRTVYPGLSLSIDIGGGSTDIAVFKNSNNIPDFISSFKFAGNAIFGDGFPSLPFSNNSDNNGFVIVFKKIIEKFIQTGTQRQLIFNDILIDRKDSSDFSSFLFSLEKEPDITFNYSEMLTRDRNMKLPILIFFGAIFYYSANLIKRLDIKEMPKNILFSGTASKTLKIIDSNTGFPNIKQLLLSIIKDINEIEINSLTIALDDNPKEITCKGILRANINDDITNCPTVFWLGGNINSVWGKAVNKKEDITSLPYYRELENNNNKLMIVNTIEHFFGILDNFVNKTDIEGNFGINITAYSKFQKIRSLNIQDYLEQGVKAFYKSPDKRIEESLFFYPLIGILNRLSYELSNLDQEMN